jgi:hypothetical protein
MKVIVRCAKSVSDITDVAAAILASGFRPTEIVTGLMNEELDIWSWSHEMGYKTTRVAANYFHYGDRAGDVRDAEMIEYADALVALYDGQDRGTYHLIQRARAAGVLTYVFDTDHGL